jgi:hypothetical protein
VFSSHTTSRSFSAQRGVVLSLSPFGANDVEDVMKTKRAGIEIWDLDENGLRCAVALDGLVRYVGGRDECLRRAKILVEVGDRDRQDQMLARVIR